MEARPNAASVSDSQGSATGYGFISSRKPPDRSSSVDWRQKKGWNSPSWWDLQLSTSLVAQTSAQGVLSICDGHLNQLHLVNVATALHRIAKAKDTHEVLENRNLVLLMARLHELIPSHRAQNCLKGGVSFANVLWACAKMAYMDLPLFEIVSLQALKHLSGSDCQECSNMTWAFATLEICHDELLKNLRAKSLELLPEFTMQDLSNTSWAYAKLGLRDTPFMECISKCARAKIGDGIPQNLSNLVWSYATLALANAPLFKLVAQAAKDNLTAYEIQDLSNIAWAFATCEYGHQTLLECIAEELSKRTHDFVKSLDKKSKAELHDRAFALVSFAWVYAFLDIRPVQLHESLTTFLCLIGNEIDGRMTTTQRERIENESGNERTVFAQWHPLPEPSFEIKARGMTVIMKPAGWEVDGPQSEIGSQGLLSNFLKANFPRRWFPLPNSSHFQYGFIHRLDIPSSGLILAGTTFAGLYALRLQINRLEMRREYCVVCHHLVSERLRECNAKIDMVAKRSRDWGIGSCSISEHGKPAKTWFTCLSHLCWNSYAHSLVSIRIHTGRNHQIRTHLLHSSHPTAVDGKYTCRDLLLSSDPLRLEDIRSQLATKMHQPSSKQLAVSPSLRCLPKSTSAIELRAAPGEDTEDGRRRPHLWTWGNDASGSFRVQML